MCTVPVGKSIFFPILDVVWWAPEDLPFAEFLAEFLGLDPSLLTDEELLRLAALWTMDHTTDLECAVDGVPLQNLQNYRADAQVFGLTFPVGNVVGQDPGPRDPAWSDGYWVMLAPLSKGSHTIQFSGRLVFTTPEDPFDFEFETEATYNLTIAPRKP